MPPAGLDWHALHVIFTIVLAIYTFFSSIRRADRTELDRLKSRVEGISRSVTQLHAEVSHLPDADTIRELVEKLSKVAALFEQIEKRFDRIENRFDNYEHAVLGGK